MRDSEVAGSSPQREFGFFKTPHRFLPREIPELLSLKIENRNFAMTFRRGAARRNFSCGKVQSSRALIRDAD